jgi:hypothetical protein
MKFAELCTLYDMSMNFKAYRETLANAQLPIVPYLGKNSVLS